MRAKLFLTILILTLGGVTVALANPLARQEDDADRFRSNWPNTDFTQTIVPLDEIRAVVFRDQIPPYYPPEYIYPDHVPQLGGNAPRRVQEYTDVASTDEWLPDQQQVVAVEVNGDAVAFPLILLNNAEIANTFIGDVPVAVTFCPLCNASIVYDRRVGDRVLHFGVSGNLRFSDLVMWDHETESWWQQFTGEGIVGEFAGELLTAIPSLVVSWADFKTAYPDGRVLANTTGSSSLLDNVSYAGYDLNDEPFLFFEPIDERLFPVERVLGYFGPEGAVAYPFERLAEAKIANDRIGDVPAVVMWQVGAVSLFTSSMEVGSAGLYLAVLEDDTELSFVNEDGAITDEQTGSTWNVFGEAISGELQGARLEPLRAEQHFWFAWAAFRPDTIVWEAGQISDEAWR
jgi:hypothetical protein